LTNHEFQLQALFTNLLISAYQMAADGASADVAADAADVARLVFTTCLRGIWGQMWHKIQEMGG
jgi:hypothetical protein